MGTAARLRAARVCLCVLLLAAACCASSPEPYLAAFGQLDAALADRLAALVGAEEPLAEADLRTLLAAVRSACAAGPSSPRYQLRVSDLVAQYGRGPEGSLDRHGLEQACAAIMACQLDEACTLAEPPPAGGLADPGQVPVTPALRLAAAGALFLEGLAGVYIPVLIKTVEGYEWWLSLLNCFSGGVFLAAGLVHLLPHCQESQAKLTPLVGDYPLYLVLITLGYMLVLFVERVLFDVHGAAHGHGPHTGIAPPCVDCRTAEDAAAASEDSGAHANGSAAAAAAGTPGQGRYNLRNRADGAAGGTPAAAAGAAGGRGGGLRKPLLAGDDDEQPLQLQPPEGGGEQAGHSHSHAHGSSHRGHSHGHSPPHHHHAASGELRQGVVLLVAMSVHTFLESMALGLMEMRKEFLMLFIAIASHKLISGLALSSRFLKEGASTRQITLCLGPFTLVAPGAILAGVFMSGVNPVVHLALSCFATGTFLYVGASEIVEEEFEGDMRSGRTDISQVFARWIKFALLLLGVASIALLSLVPDAHDHGHAGGGGHLHHH